MRLAYMPIVYRYPTAEHLMSTIQLVDHCKTVGVPLYYRAMRGDALIERIKPLAKKTMREGVLAGIGGFGALFEVPKRYKEPVLVSGTDGVGTKLRLAFEWNRHDTIGQDMLFRY